MKAFLMLLLLLPGVVRTQDQEAQVWAYNVGFGGLTAGVGAVINKKEGENWRKTFVRGFWQGSIGGALTYSAKKAVYGVSKNNSLAYALPVRVLHAVGSSIIQNAAANGPFLKAWSFEYAFVRFDYSAGAHQKLQARVLPVSVAASAVSFSKGRLDWGTTLLTGVMTFKAIEMINTPNGHYDGVNYGRAFIYYEDLSKYHIIAHEIIHEYQYREYLVFNSYLHRAAAHTKATGLKKVFTHYVYPDVPYLGPFYMLEGVRNGPRYFRNYYEFEAERMSTNEHVRIE